MKAYILTAAALALVSGSTLVIAQGADTSANPPKSVQDKVQNEGPASAPGTGANQDAGALPAKPMSPADKLGDSLDKSAGSASSGAASGTNDTTGIAPRNPADKQVETQTGK